MSMCYSLVLLTYALHIGFRLPFHFLQSLLEILVLLVLTVSLDDTTQVLVHILLLRIDFQPDDIHPINKFTTNIIKSICQ